MSSTLPMKTTQLWFWQNQSWSSTFQPRSISDDCWCWLYKFKREIYNSNQHQQSSEIDLGWNVEDQLWFCQNQSWVVFIGKVEDILKG